MGGGGLFQQMVVDINDLMMLKLYCPLFIGNASTYLRRKEMCHKTNVNFYNLVQYLHTSSSLPPIKLHRLI